MKNLKKLWKEGILFAASKCHNLHTREVPWNKTVWIYMCSNTVYASSE